MRIFLNILGERLFERVAKEVAALDSAFPRRLGSAKLLSWHLERLAAPFQAKYLQPASDDISVLLVEISDAAELGALWNAGFQHPESESATQKNDVPQLPLILVFDERYSEAGFVDMPLIVTDWVCGVGAMHELARRVITSLRRQKYLHDELGTGHLKLNLESRKLVFHGDSVQLSPAELPIAELFMSHAGSVIPIDEIQLMFRLAGRSVTGSNIRVTIFQLRFKIELLTRHQFTLVCAYGEGYALRPGKAADPPFPNLEARQPRVSYYSNA